METPESNLTIDEGSDLGFQHIEVWAQDIRQWRQYGDSYADYTTQRLIEDLTNTVVFLARQVRLMKGTVAETRP